MNIPEVVLCRYMHSFLFDTFLSVGLLGHEMCSCFILLDLGGFFQTHLETSLVLSPTLSALLPPKVSPFCFCDQACFLTCMFLSTGQKEGATPPGGLQENGGPTDCQIVTLTPPPPRRNPVTRIQLVTRTPKCPFHSFPWQGPRVHIRFPHRPFFPHKCNHRFPFRPFFWPPGPLIPYYQYFPRGTLWRGSSSEESG